MHLKLPPPVLTVIGSLTTAGFEAYIVGGAVRDLLQQKDTTDWDFTTKATPEEIQKIFPDSFYDNHFGTVGITGQHLLPVSSKAITKKWLAANWLDQVYEITTFRQEYGYSDKRHPDKIVWGKTLTEDLARRDFTINAIALKIHNPQSTIRNLSASTPIKTEVDIIDPYNGQVNLDQKLIRAVGDAKERFHEDALRMMRAIRLGAQLGFTIEPKTLTAIKQHANLIIHISWERIRDELLKIIASSYSADGILLLHSAGLLEFILPELLETRNVPQAGHHIYDVWTHSLESLRHCPSTDPLVRLATLLHDIGKPQTFRRQGPRGITFYGHEVVGARLTNLIAQRLRLSTKQSQKLTTLVRWHMFTYNPEMTDASIRRFIRRVGLENINDMLLLRVGDRKGGGSKATSWRLRQLQERIGQQLYEPMSLKDMKVNGLDVMKTLKIEPGPKIGQILNQLFEEILEDTSKNNRKYLISRIKKLK
ncbi:hypothetical protein A3A66_04155 [Microgenomates group bacterium RIFCSPLOWO2_01_FULL_46_13]|nr:MAG: hypothetical protein A2783_03625 [Microgenomates group bacterium RIFCSPHIGHO2_01_FULL_45_11]OGV94978.1 MAG: hypothetical protein A3A66_04155 [Microgenomates group bacterium RIFCSPLOWO2_01_FULL_46_13]